MRPPVDRRTATVGESGAVQLFLLPLRGGTGPGRLFCLFSPRQIVEVLPGRPVVRVPGSAGPLVGVHGHRDRILPVFSLEALCLAGPPLAGTCRQLVVVRTRAIDRQSGEPLRAVIATASRPRTMTLSGEALAGVFVPVEPPPSLRASGLVRGFFRHRDHGLALIDLSPVLIGEAAREEDTTGRTRS